MFRMSLALTAVALIAGCSTSASIGPSAGEQPRLASFAASVTYPVNATPSRDYWQTVAVVGPNRDNLTIANPTDQPITDLRVWINGQYVTHIDSVPAYGAVTLRRADFYSGSGQMLSVPFANADRIELQIGDTNKLYELHTAWE